MKTLLRRSASSLCTSSLEAILCSHSKRARGRVVLEIGEYTEDEENAPLRIAVVVLSARNGSAALNVVINTLMAQSLQGRTVQVRLFI